MAEAAFKLKSPEAAPYRELPHNIEAEQGLLGAILINNEAFHRVADFLKVNHFFEPLHGETFEVISELIRSNKVANPITLKTFFPATLVVAGLSVTQYLARLAAEVSKTSMPKWEVCSQQTSSSSPPGPAWERHL